MDKFKVRLQKIALSMQRNKYLSAISNGLAATLPVLMIGAFSTLLANLPIDSYKIFIADIGLKPFLALPAEMTTNIISIYAVFLIAFKLAESFEQDGMTVGIIALMSFFVITPFQLFDKVKAIPYSYLGAGGLFAAMFTALIVTKIYCVIVDHNWVIKMPDTVPETITKTFNGLIPGFICIIVFTTVAGLFSLTEFGGVHKFIYTILQQPLLNVGGSFSGVLIFLGISQMLWLFGIHGTMVTGAIWKPIYIAMDLANLAAFQNGEPLPYIIGMAFFAMCLLGGGGATLGLNLLMVFKGKSKQLVTIGKMALPTSIVNINEPLIFGVPVVLNPILAIPFIISPLFNACFLYGLTTIGILPRMIGIYPALGVPVLVSGFIQGSVLFIGAQLVMLLVNTAFYYPFFKKLDQQKVKEELGEEVEAM